MSDIKKLVDFEVRAWHGSVFNSNLVEFYILARKASEDGAVLRMSEGGGYCRYDAQKMEWVEVRECEHNSPSFTGTMDDAQSLMDELWKCGLRPTEGKGSAGCLAATERHLEDMRALVFKTQKPKMNSLAEGGGQ